MSPQQRGGEARESCWDWLPWELQLAIIQLAMRKGPLRILPRTLVGNPNFVHTGYVMGCPIYTHTYTVIRISSGMSSALYL